MKDDKPLFPKGRSASPKASRAPHRKTNQAQEQHDVAVTQSCQGAREVNPAGRPGQPERRSKQRHSTSCNFPPAGCPISAEINQVIDLSEDLNRAMRQLRRKLNACGKCPLDDQCGFRRAFQGRVDAMIQEVINEWGMP